MKISSIQVDMNEKDLFGLIKEVVDEHLSIEELDIISVLVQDSIFLEGTFKHKMKIKFSVKLSLDKLEENVLYFNIDSIRCMNIKIRKFVIKLVFKMFLQKYKEIGLELEDGKLVINLNKIMPLIPYVSFNLNSLELLQGNISTRISELTYDIKKEAVDIEEIIGEEKKVQEVIEEGTCEDCELKESEIDEENKSADEVSNSNAVVEDSCATVNKVSDIYSTMREKTEEFIDKKYKGISQYALMIPDMLALILRLFKDKRVKKKDKIIAGIMLTYVVTPIDLIPEGIPLLGQLDDIIILIIGLDYLINSVDENVILENWEGKQEIIPVIKQGIKYVSELSAGGKIKKFVDLVSNL